MKYLVTFYLVLSSVICFGINEKDTVWQLLEKHQLTEARSILEGKANSGTSTVDQFCTLMFLNIYEGQEVNLELMKKAISQMEDPSPYLYAMWFTDAVTNGYEKKKPDRLLFLQQLQQNSKIHPIIKAGNNYILGMHYLMSNDFQMAYTIWGKLGSLKKWQITGPFDNTSGSGFDKNYKPIFNPGPNDTFESEINGTLRWFVPEHPQKDPYVATSYYQPKSIGISYAQTFLNCPDEKDVILGLGCTGSVKVWVNDKLLVANEEEYTTEIDYFKAPCHLNAGYNRILVQVGYTSETPEPNFLIRILDKSGISVPGLTSVAEFQNYITNVDTTRVTPQQNFAEKHFKDLIEADSANPVNYILLSKVYERTNRHNDALEILKLAEKMYPENVLIKYEILTNLLGLSNRTELLKYMEDLRSADSCNLMISAFDFEVNLSNENYELAQENLDAIGRNIGTKNITYYWNSLRLYAAKNMQVELINTILAAYKDYPENADFTLYYYYYKKISTNSIKAGMKILKKYLQKNYNYQIYRVMLDEYENAGMQSSKVSTLRKLHQLYPEEKSFTNDLISHLYSSELYAEALQMADYGISNDPFNSDFYNSKAYISLASGNKEMAIDNFNLAIGYNPNLFESREMLRTLQDKRAVLTILENKNAYKNIYAALAKPANEEDNYEIVFNNTSNVIFNEGASIEFKTLACKINTQVGVDRWKEISIKFNSNYQRIIISKAEVIKPNKQKIAGERNYNQIVFPSLEKGDVIYVEYRLENYTWGKLSTEYSTSFNFSDFAPVHESIFKIYVSSNFKFNQESANFEMKPEVTTVDDFTCYEWNFVDIPRCKEEKYMPPLDDAGKYLCISTIDNWAVISNWYRDLALPQAKSDYYSTNVYNQIFQNKNYTTQYDKANAIYEWICKNISYSSISFRQSSFVPQKPTKTINTKLGDCKDLSLLFLSLARMADIKTNLVLVNTKNMGEKSLLLPCVNFNHCIVRLELDGQEYFQELTEKNLAFGVWPKTLVNAQALIIPNDSVENFGKVLINLPDKNRHQNSFVRNTEITIIDKKLNIKTKLTTSGVVASMFRDYFYGSTKSEIEDKAKDILDDPFKTDVKVMEYKYDDPEKRDSLWTFTGECVVSDEVKTIGSLHILKVPFYEDIFTSDVFNEEERNFPVQYWRYELADHYTTIVNIDIPKGMTVEEIPQNFHIQKSFINYNLEVKVENNSRVVVVRNVDLYPMTIPVDQYKDFQETIKKILKAEDFFVSFK